MTDVIVFEGIDAVGKTTVARQVAAHLRRPLFGVPTEDLRLSAADLLCDITSRARYLYYMAAALRLSEKLGEVPVVLDRYIDSVHAMHAPFHEELATLLRSVPVRAPDLVIVLEADEEARQARLVNRGRELDPFERRLQDAGFRAEVRAEYRRREEAVIVDTSGLTIEAVIARCLQVVRDADGRRVVESGLPLR